MKLRKPKRRVYRKLDPNFASDYVKVLRLLSRKHKTDDVEEVKGILHLLKNMSANLFYTGRGEVWIPKPSTRTGYYPIIEKVPYTTVRRAIRSNTSEAVRARAWGVVASSAEPFVPLFARRPGSLTEAQRRSLLAHAMVALPFVKGRHPTLLGKRVPGELGVSDIGTRSIIPVKRMAPEDWEKGFTMRKFSLSEDLSVQYGVKEWWVKHKEAAWKRMQKATPLERKILGREDLTVSQARELARKELPPGTKATIGRGKRPLFSWKRKELVAPPHTAAITHEATHARQHKKLGRWFVPLYKGLPIAGALGAATLAAGKRGRLKHLKRLPRWVAPATATASFAPKLGLEAHAAAKAHRKKGGRRATMLTASYPVEAAAITAGATLGGGQVGKLIKATRILRKQIRRGPRFMRGRYSLSEDLSKSIKRKLTAKPRVPNPTMRAPKIDLKDVLKRAMDTGVKLEPTRYDYILSDIDRMCYDDGVREWLKGAKRKTGRVWKRVTRWVKGEVLPTVARNVTLGMAGLAHTELGIPPTTVDLLPVQRVGLKRDLQPYPSRQLRKVVESLQQRLVSEIDPVLRKGLEKGVSEIATELMVRSAMPGFI